MQTFTIRDLENLSGIKAHTIRIWEQRYNFLKPDRTETNIRYYNNDDLKVLLNIALLNKHGFKISHINEMNPKEINDNILSLKESEAKVDKILNSLIECMIELEMDKLEEILNKYILKQGIKNAVIDIMFPFLERIGILWMTDHINPAQEHFISNIIRQKLIAGIDKLGTVTKVNEPVLLFLPENEHHELGLLFVNYLLKAKGITTIYLGANIPIGDVEYVFKIKAPAYIYIHLIGPCPNFDFNKFITMAAKKFSSVPIVISGERTQAYSRKLPKPVIFKRSMIEVMEFIDNI
ncbi:MAG: MerR family transcriptional regulator [Bacteroidota bacterium]